MMTFLKTNRFILAVALFAQTASAAEFHVAATGNDVNPGTADNPFASLEKARDAARAAPGPDTVVVHGIFRLAKTFELNEQDSGTTFKGVDGASLRGSIAIPNTAVKPVADKAVLDRLLPEAQGKVLEIDLKALGITDFGEIGPRGFRRPYLPAPLELFIDDEPLRLAQWPNPGQPGISIGKVLDKGPVTRNGAKPDRGGTFEFKTDRPDRWTQAEDVWITGLFENGYADNTVKVKAFDLAKRTITTVQPHMYGFSSGKPWNRWVALNLLEEIDQPGEFMADKKSGMLYFLPPFDVDLATCRLEASRLQEPLVAIEGATGVAFDGVDIECSRGMGVYIERGANNRIQNGTLRNIGMVAVCIGKGISPDPDYRHAFTGTPVSRQLGSWHEHLYDNVTFNRDAGTGHGILNDTIYNIGAGAISLGGGDRKSLAAAGNFVENCDIHHFNRWDRTYKGAVNIDGVGNRIAHCKLHEAPAVAIYLHGNDHLIEYNEIFNVMTQGDDMGAFYMGRDPTERGNIIRYNYWHDSAQTHMTGGLYFDDSGGDSTQIYGNVFRRIGNTLGSVFIAGGSDFVVKNNVFIDCKKPIYPQGFRSGSFGIFKKRMADVGYDSPEWKKRYPEFQDYIASKKPHNNSLKDNLIIKGDDPRLADPANGNYSLKPGADAGIPGFEPIPFEKIGLTGQGPARLPAPPPPAETKTSRNDATLGLHTGGQGAWKFYPAARPDPARPRVLLIGDSIVNGYRIVVINALKDKADVDVWLTPAAENDPGLLQDLEKVLRQGPYAVVHFNIGLHGWPKGRIPDGQYEPVMRNYVKTLKTHAGDARLIWASSTPITVKGKPAELDPTDNPTIVTRNASAALIMQGNGILVNDLYGLVVDKRAEMAAGDRYHWKAPAYELMGRQAAEAIGQQLPAHP